MLSHPNAKINIGLSIVSRRADGYHNLETVFVPLPFLVDDLLIERAEEFSFSCNVDLGCTDDSNLVVRVYRAMQSMFHLPEVSIRLTKNIPFGAGLGGGSADAAFAALALNEMFMLGLSNESLQAIVAPLGADCSFFIANSPCLATGIGDNLTPIPLSIDAYAVVVKPNAGVSTAQAYSKVTPKAPTFDLRTLPSVPIEQWKDCVVNDFEDSVFSILPEIGHIKTQLYRLGARYASMSGSGSAVFALFDKDRQPDRRTLANTFPGLFIAEGRLKF